MRIIAIALLVMLASCRQQEHVDIFDKDPFVKLELKAPSGGAEEVIARSKKFALDHNMVMESSQNHFEKGEYSLILKDKETNIVSANVGRDQISFITAYSIRANDKANTSLVKAYLCVVFLKCE